MILIFFILWWLNWPVNSVFLLLGLIMSFYSGSKIQITGGKTTPSFNSFLKILFQLLIFFGVVLIGFTIGLASLTLTDGEFKMYESDIKRALKIKN
jgi:hypothetical protein